jgi:hypothetical protein
VTYLKILSLNLSIEEHNSGQDSRCAEWLRLQNKVDSNISHIVLRGTAENWSRK